MPVNYASFLPSVHIRHPMCWQIPWALLLKYIQHLTFFYHLHIPNPVQATIISHLGYCNIFLTNFSVSFSPLISPLVFQKQIQVLSLFCSKSWWLSLFQGEGPSSYHNHRTYLIWLLATSLCCSVPLLIPSSPVSFCSSDKPSSLLSQGLCPWFLSACNSLCLDLHGSFP